MEIKREQIKESTDRAREEYGFNESFILARLVNQVFTDHPEYLKLSEESKRDLFETIVEINKDILPNSFRSAQVHRRVRERFGDQANLSSK